MTFPLETRSSAVEDRAHNWTVLGMRWQVRTMEPNCGKAFVNAQFDSAA
ncbi:hypothetical protein [Dactylosporangium sp. NPDC000521]